MKPELPAPRHLLAAVLLLAAAPLSASPPEYRIDPVHTRIVFAVEHLGFSQALGTLSGPRGRLRFDPDDWTGAEVEVEIPLDRLDLGDADWNARMARRSFFDSARHPVARFVSTKVEPLADDRARILGRLSLRGVEREVVLDVRLNRIGRNSLTFRRTVGFSATATLSRSAFGMTAWQNSVGDAVELRIELEATRARRTSRDDEEPGHAMEEQP